MRLALYEPDIPQNTGTILRLGACLDVPVDIIEPCGFAFSERSLQRAGLDYLDQVQMVRHLSWDHFLQASRPIPEPPGGLSGRLVLLTTRAPLTYTDFAFERDDILLLGRESAGVPDAVHDAVDHRVTIPIAPGLRSLNIAVAAAMVLGEAMRQTQTLPSQGTPE